MLIDVSNTQSILVGIPHCERYKMKLIKIPPISWLTCVVIYYDFILPVSSPFGHQWLYHTQKRISGGREIAKI